MSEELKPCPFCGRNGRFSYGCGYEIYCEECGSRVETYPSKEQAIEMWNRRPSPWHTGTPTEDGWYLVECQIGNFKFYATDHWNNKVGYWTVSKVIRWQKIEE